jgi:hypothetical protein
MLAPILSVATWTNPDESDADYFRKDASGMKVKEASSFLYFYDVLGLFPLATANDETKKIAANPGSAKKFIRENPDKLRMEVKHWYRFGEHARIFTLLPSYYLNGNHRLKTSVKTFNVIVFSTTIIILGLALFKQFGFLPAVIGVTLVSSSQFLIAESVLRENIFAIHPLLHIFSISCYLLIVNSTFANKVTVSLVLSILIGFASEIRGENTTAIAVSLLFWLILSGESTKRKLLMLAVCVAILLLTKTGIKLYFENLHSKTVAVVTDSGGVPFEGVKTAGHPIWHPLLAGLGDFGTDKGFIWSDKDIFLLVQEKSPLESEDVSIKQYYDTKTKYYYKRYETKEGYSKYARQLYINTLKDDPYWFAKIIANRIYATMTKIPPLKINFYYYHFELNRYIFSGLLFSAMIIIYRKRSWHPPTKVECFIILAALSMSANAILIHSGKGITYAATYQYWIVILLLSRLAAPKHQVTTVLQT